VEDDEVDDDDGGSSGGGCIGGVTEGMISAMNKDSGPKLVVTGKVSVAGSVVVELSIPSGFEESSEARPKPGCSPMGDGGIVSSVVALNPCENLGQLPLLLPFFSSNDSKL